MYPSFEPATYEADEICNVRFLPVTGADVNIRSLQLKNDALLPTGINYLYGNQSVMAFDTTIGNLQ